MMTMGMLEIVDMTFMDVIFGKYPVSFIMIVNTLVGVTIGYFLYAPQIKHLMKLILTLLDQVEAINTRRN